MSHPERLERRHFLRSAGQALGVVGLSLLTACTPGQTVASNAASSATLAPSPQATAVDDPVTPTASPAVEPLLQPTPLPATTVTVLPAASPTSVAPASSTPRSAPSGAGLRAPVPPPPGNSAQPDYLQWAKPGPYRLPQWTDFRLQSFSASQGVVFAYFFYWYQYRVYQANVQARGGDYYLLHPTDFAQTDFTRQAWYDKQFRDMLAAGIDVVLPDYWGEPGQYNQRVAPAPELNLFSTQGLPPMIAALQALAARGAPLRIGLFLDTTIMSDEDFTTTRGKQIFYATIRDYYSRIPPAFWAAIDRQPIVWLYDAQKVAAFDQSTFDYVYAHFAADFGGLRPYIVREWQWYESKNAPTKQIIRTEGLYSWGAAPSGFNPDPRFTVAEVGPGFNNAHFGRQNGLVTDRRGGQYYVDNLERALASGRRLLAIETWNELGETSGILETVEYGRQYIDLTRRYADRLKARFPG